MSDTSLKELGRFFDPTQMHIIRGLLETNDIECFIFDEAHHSVAWTISLATGGTRIMVMKKDLQRAREILHDAIEKSPKSIEQQNFKKPYWKTILGTVIGIMASATSIKPYKDKNSDDEL